jgi:DNA-binding CsgD family transcriptional regulator
MWRYAETAQAHDEEDASQVTRQARESQWSALRRHVVALSESAVPTWLAQRVWDSSAFAQLVACLTSVIILAIQGRFLAPTPETQVWIGIALGFGFLRILTTRQKPVTTTLILDALGTVVFLGGTGGIESPFYPLALAGGWWAALAIPGRGLLYGITFAASYAVLVLPIALREPAPAAGFYLPGAIVIITALADQLIAMDRRATELTKTAASSVLDAEQRSTRQGLSRALPASDVPIHALLTAGQLGLTAIQTELLAYLILGLTNLEIADAAGLSEAAVRYRLTRLYQKLGVRGRKAAADRARELGLGDLALANERPAA